MTPIVWHVAWKWIENFHIQQLVSIVLFGGIFLVSWINCLDFRLITTGKWGKLASLISWHMPSLLPLMYFLFKVDCQPSDNAIGLFRVPWGVSPSDCPLRLQKVFARELVSPGQDPDGQGCDLKIPLVLCAVCPHGFIMLSRVLCW